MLILILGLAVWAGVHFLPTFASAFRTGLIEKRGKGPYQGMFALLIVASVVMIVFGWRSISPVYVYAPLEWSKPVAALFVLTTFVLFAAARSKTNIKRYIRHPQLTGLVVWSIGHLIANGDHRSLMLFGALGVWAVLEIIFISKREGAWVKPEPVPLTAEFLLLLKGGVVFTVLLFAHPYFTGIAIISW